MTISRKHTIVLLAACLFAAGSTVFLSTVRKDPGRVLTYQCYQTANGWGYDILYGKKILIHQPFKPGVPGRSGFAQQRDAAAIAQIVIEKIKSGEMPVFSHDQVQRPGKLHTQVK